MQGAFETETRPKKITAHLDWLTASFPSSYNFVDEFSDGWTPLQIEDEIYPPPPHYQEAYKLVCGGRWYISRDANQGNRIDLSGEPLEYLRGHKAHDETRMIEELVGKVKNFTRIDYAFNLHGGAVHVMDIRSAYLNSAYRSTFKKAPKEIGMLGLSDGRSLTFGTRKGDSQVQIYDKAAEVGLLAEAWVRVELRQRRARANALGEHIARYGIHAACQAQLATLLDFPGVRWWQQLMEGDKPDAAEVGKKTPAWEKWMDQTVKGSIKKRLERGESHEFIESWLADLAAIMLAAGHATK